MSYFGFYKTRGREFYKRRWPIMELASQKISNMHGAFHHSPRRGPIALAGWCGKTGNGTMHIFDVRGIRLIQVRKIENGYIAEMLRGKQAEDFDSVWWHKVD